MKQTVFIFYKIDIKNPQNIKIMNLKKEKERMIQRKQTTFYII